MSVIVEGVESFEEVAYLQAATRIRYAQCYYYSKPMMLEDVGHADLIRDESRGSVAGTRA
jgi:cyclic di-GMP phosphodiesterase Gmr